FDNSDCSLVEARAADDRHLRVRFDPDHAVSMHTASGEHVEAIPAGPLRRECDDLEAGSTDTGTFAMPNCCAAFRRIDVPLNVSPSSTGPEGFQTAGSRS